MTTPNENQADGVDDVLASGPPADIAPQVAPDLEPDAMPEAPMAPPEPVSMTEPVTPDAPLMPAQGAPSAAPYAAAAPQAYAPPHASAPPQQYGAPNPTPKTWMNITAFVTGILGLAIIPIIIGHLGISASNKGQAEYKWMGIVGAVLGYLTVVAYVIITAVVIGALAAST